ncbi:MAG: hypothetical protein H6556_27775 [Lewinellaceae bacterium]|nr:hypothetical protein [Lewinellaceae bacterium]
MNVFILCTGRSGSMTFIRACQHIDNYTADHESRVSLTGAERLDFPDNHIEADNRLSWMLGKLGKKYGKDAFYVHLRRDREITAISFNRRWDYPNSIIKAYTEGILMAGKMRGLEYCVDYVDTVTDNIEHFLRDKPNKLVIDLEEIKTGFRKFWSAIGAEGDLQAALHEMDHHYNRSKKNGTLIQRIKNLVNR